MTEKRKFPRYTCKIKASYEYYEGNPEEIDTSITIAQKGGGFILDISCGGIFIVTNDRIPVGIPIKISFSTKHNSYNLTGHIVRTGLFKHNPSEIAQKYEQFSSKGDSYLAVEFDAPLETINTKEL